jgi:integrase
MAKRRARGDGTVYRQGRIWWIAYRGPDGIRKAESSGGENKGVAVDLLRRRTGARDHGLPVIPGVERYTFDEAAQAVIDDFKTNGKRSLRVAERRIKKHLLPFFGGRRLASIRTADARQFVAHRQAQGIVAVRGERKGERIGDVSNAEINRELQLLKRIFNFAIEGERLATRPKIAMLRESNARAGFFEADQYASVLGHLPSELQPIVWFAYLTGWRTHSEILPLEWRRVDFAAGEVRLDPGTTKNGEGRVFPMTNDLRRLLEAQRDERDRLKAKGIICPWVFFRMVAEGRGGEKRPRRVTSFTKAWKVACRQAGCPGRILHDFRRTAVRNLIRAGISEGVAMKMTGHKTRSVFERYNIVSEGDLKDAVARLDLVAAGGAHRR